MTDIELTDEERHNAGLCDSPFCDYCTEARALHDAGKCDYGSCPYEGDDPYA